MDLGRKGVVCCVLVLLVAEWTVLAQSLATHPKSVHRWVQMEYDWASMGQDRNEWIAQGLFVPENCVLAGIKQWEDTTYVTIPRWAPGVPATLNQITVDSNGSPLLLPFPSWEDQLVNTTKGLKNVQSNLRSLPFSPRTATSSLSLSL